MAETWGKGPVEAAPEVRARVKHTCPACGAEATWNPARQALVCGFCGTTAPGRMEDAATGEIVEHDLPSALRSIPDNKRGWGTQKQSVKCQSCQAISVFDATRQSQSCEFCGSTALVPYDEVKDSFSPESLLPMKIAGSKARDLIKTWYGSRWFAPNKLKKAALTDTVKGIYIPYWTFDAQVSADWEAEAGYHYYETETYTDGQGNRQTRQIQHTRWEYASGHLDHFFDDELVPASLGIQANHLRAVEPFPTTELVPYDPAYLSGWVVERYQIDLVAAAQRSREQMEQQVQSMCASAVPGDTYRNLQVRAGYGGQTFKHILAPLWMLQYRYGMKNFQVVMNGYTGKISGDYPKSWIKIALATLAAIIILLIVFSVSGNR
ncbi:MAG TPA: zinc ribbon domain-containing protein [Burkholderiales bacterium]|nr:zinc ribbon domain-containing protein [Burkholderiales bacterium]